MPETGLDSRAAEAAAAVARDASAEALGRRFSEIFGEAPAAVAAAPGRINLIGEHTDYNQGLVLPTPLNLWTRVAVGPPAEPGRLDVASAAQGEAVVERSSDGQPRGDWSDYVAGCLAELRRRGATLTGARVAVQSDIPMGAGVSSSAALEIATLRALASLAGVTLSGYALAEAGQAAERDFVGMPCGIMDQMAVATCAPDEALFLDCQSFEARAVPIPESWRFAAIHSGVSHRLVSGDYGRRQDECHAAAQKLGLASLRPLAADDSRLAELPQPLAARARHVARENARVEAAVTALEQGEAKTFGRLMADSHASLRDDFAVSVPEMDRLVAACHERGALGARMTGGGFGGAAVALLPAEANGCWSARTAQAVPGAWAIV